MERHKVYAAELSLTERKKIWDEIVSDFTKSNIKQPEYCRMHGINEHSLSYQRARRQNRKPPTSPAFIPVTVSHPNIASKFTVALPNGLEIKIECDFSVLNLEKVFAIASKIKC